MSVPAVDPEIQTLLETADTGVFPVHGLDAVLADPERYALLRARPDTPVDDQVAVRDLYIPGPGGQLRLRVYRPGTPEVLPMILYVHGGAYTYGSPEAEEGRSLRYARDARAVVVSVDYRLAPEHPFPAAADDAYAALAWIAANSAELGGDPSRIAVAGGSAGGNIAASTVLRARDQAGPRLLFQSLTYPGVDAGLTTDSAREFTTPRSSTGARWNWPCGTTRRTATPTRTPSRSAPPT
ncbi:alpha/beta hydrolase fold domain-containing protein [Streptomyces albus]